MKMCWNGPVFMYDFKVEVKRQYEYCQAVKSEH